MKEENLQKGNSLKSDLDYLSNFIKKLSLIDSENINKKLGFFGVIKKKFPLSVIKIQQNAEIIIDPISTSCINLSIGNFKAMREPFIKTRSKIFKYMIEELTDLKNKANKELDLL